MQETMVTDWKHGQRHKHFARTAVPLRRHARQHPRPRNRHVRIARIIRQLEDEAVLVRQKFPGRIGATDFGVHPKRLAPNALVTLRDGVVTDVNQAGYWIAWTCL